MTYSLVMAFDTNSQEFCRGFEAGALYEQAQRFANGEQINDTDPDDAFTRTLHATNTEMVLRIAETHGLHARSEELGDGWIAVTLTRTADEP